LDDIKKVGGFGMLEMKECCKVPFPEKLFEEYEIKDHAVYANVNASKIQKIWCQLQ